MKGAGYQAGLYIGSNFTQLTADQYNALPFDVFYKSESNVPTPGRGFVLVQAFLDNNTNFPGTDLTVDYDTSQDDSAGKSAFFVHK